MIVTIFLSAIGSLIAPTKLYSKLVIVNLIIGKAHIPMTIIIPTKPIAFFMSVVAPRTVSTESPNALPTTGIKVEATDFIPFTVIPSTLLVNVPSNDNKPTNTVITNPKNQVILEVKNFERFPI